VTQSSSWHHGSSGTAFLQTPAAVLDNEIISGSTANADAGASDMHPKTRDARGVGKTVEPGLHVAYWAVKGAIRRVWRQQRKKLGDG